MSSPKYIIPNLENTSTHLSLYFLVLFPEEHHYALFAIVGMHDFKKLFDTVVTSEPEYDYSNEVIIEITRAQFLSAITQERIDGAVTYDTKDDGCRGWGFAVQKLPDNLREGAKKEKAAKLPPKPPAPHKLTDGDMKPPVIRA